MNRHSDVAEHGFGARSGDGQTRLVLRADDGIGDVIQVSQLLAMLCFFVTERSEAARAPVNYSVAAIDEPTLVQLHERFAHRARELRRKRVSRPVPVARRTDGAQLLENLAAGLLDEADGALDERRAPEIEFGLSLGGELLLDDVLGGDSRVIGAGHPERFVARHPAPADDHILHGIVETVAHMQHRRHVRGWHDDHERIAIAAVSLAPLFVGRKHSGLDPALVDSALSLAGVVLRRQLVKLLCCAHLWRKLAGAIFAGKTARSMQFGGRYSFGRGLRMSAGVFSGSAT